MGLMKKNGWRNSNILKNSWKSLHMMDSNVEKWPKDMKSDDTLGDEIALYVLCKMYSRHSMVYTRGNIWTTVHSDTSLDKTTLLELCDIWLLYIELGVIGELTVKVYVPPPRISFMVMLNLRTNHQPPPKPPMAALHP